MRLAAEDSSRAAGARPWSPAPPMAPARASVRRWPLLVAGAALLTFMTTCGQENRFVAPPPPKVTVQFPLQQRVTPYLEATGNVASENKIKLVARVEGYVQEIKYKDGDAVKKDTPLFVIQPEPYKIQLEQVQAAEEGSF